MFPLSVSSLNSLIITIHMTAKEPVMCNIQKSVFLIWLAQIFYLDLRGTS